MPFFSPDERKRAEETALKQAVKQKLYLSAQDIVEMCHPPLFWRFKGPSLPPMPDPIFDHMGDLDFLRMIHISPV